MSINDIEWNNSKQLILHKTYKMPHQQNLEEDICEKFTTYWEDDFEEMDKCDGAYHSFSYVIVMMILKFNLLKKMREKEEIWQNNLCKYESAVENSLSGQFFRSKRLMNCMECFVKGDPEKFEAKRVDQTEQLKKYLKLFLKYYDVMLVHSKNDSLSLDSSKENVDEYAFSSVTPWKLYKNYFNRIDTNDFFIIPSESKVTIFHESINLLASNV